MFCVGLIINSCSINWLVSFITETQAVYCAVRAESLLGAFAKLRKKKWLLASSCVFVRPHVRGRFPLDGFSVPTGRIFGSHWAYFRFPLDGFSVPTGRIFGSHWTDFRFPLDVFSVPTGRIFVKFGIFFVNLSKGVIAP